MGVLIRDRKEKTGNRAKRPHDDGGGYWSYAATKPRNAEDRRQQPDAGERQGADLVPEPPEEPTLQTTSFQTSSLQKPERVTLCVQTAQRVVI